MDGVLCFSATDSIEFRIKGGVGLGDRLDVGIVVGLGVGLGVGLAI